MTAVSPLRPFTVPKTASFSPSEALAGAVILSIGSRAF